MHPFPPLPTDITYASLAKAFDQPLEHHQETLRRMGEMTRHRADMAQQTPEQRAARERMGRMRLAMPEGPPAGPERAVPVQVAVSHPNLSGLQIDQLSRLSIPAEFVRTLRVLYRGAEVLTVECDISVAENPTFGFALPGEAGGELRVEAEDNRERRFASSWTLGNNG